MLIEENKGGYKIIHLIPDVTEEEKEEIRQKITKKIFKLFSNKKTKD